MCGERDGQRQRRSRRSLNLQEGEEARAGRVAPVVDQLSIARIVGDFQRPRDDVPAEAQRPDGDGDRDGCAAYGRSFIAAERGGGEGRSGRAHSECPDRVDPTRLVRRALDSPCDRHDRGQGALCDQQRCEDGREGHEGRASGRLKVARTAAPAGPRSLSSAGRPASRRGRRSPPPPPLGLVAHAVVAEVEVARPVAAAAVMEGAREHAGQFERRVLVLR